MNWMEDKDGLSGVLSKLEAEIVQSEQLGRLTDAQLDILHENGWFNLFVPKNLGGLGMSLPEAIRLEEKLAYTDGSLGWTVTLCAGAAWFVGFLQPEAIREIGWPHKKNICFGGSGAVGGIAECLTDGYRVQGKWAYATGAAHNTVFTANCVIHKHGAPVLDHNGSPKVRSFYFLPHEVQLIHDWNTMGLKATNSDSFEIQEIVVPSHRAFIIAPEKVVLDDPIYRYPFLPFAEVTLAANYLGMFRKFFALCKHDVSWHHQQLDYLAQEFYNLVGHSWQVLNGSAALPADLLASISKTSKKLVRTGLEAVAAEFPATGIDGASLDSAINRVWRDIFTGSQHMMFRS